MVYHHPSLTGLMLWLRYGVLRGKSLRKTVYDHLKSPGTKTYTQNEARRLMEGFEDIRCNKSSAPVTFCLTSPRLFLGSFYKLVWRFYPRPLAEVLAHLGFVPAYQSPKT